MQSQDQRVVAPWVGGRSLHSGSNGRTWKIIGKLPPEHGWYEFKTGSREAMWNRDHTGPISHEPLSFIVKGHLVGDRLVPDGARVPTEIAELPECSEQVHLFEPGLDRFVRIVAGRTFEDGPLIFDCPDFPQGPEDAVRAAFISRKASLDGILGISPTLDIAFRLEVWHREETAKRRAEEQERRRLEEEKRVLEERRRKIVEQLGDGAGRREVAKLDFAEAAKAALAIGGAEFLDTRDSYQRGEKVVQFRLNARRYECTCNSETLSIIDAGICLTDHITRKSYDNLLTLESLPAVILAASREGKLVVLRHLDYDEGDRDDRDDWDD